MSNTMEISQNDGYRPAQRKKARKTYLLFMVFNAASFWLLSNNIVTLFAIRLNATTSYIGLLSAMSYISLFAIIIGRHIAKQTPVLRLFHRAWLLRYLSMIIILPVPLLINANLRLLALFLMGAAVFGFHIFRGIGLVSNSPLIGELSTGKDRGAYLASIQIIGSSAAVVAGLTIALVLGRTAPLIRYSICFGIGIASGLIATKILAQIPPLPNNYNIEETRSTFSIADAFRNKNFAKFIISLFIFGALSGALRTFAVVYVREVYAQSDLSIALYTVAGSIGMLIIGKLSGALIDRIGAKPIYSFYATLLSISAYAVLFAPQFHNRILITIFCGLIFLMINTALAGGEYSAQIYFFGSISNRERLNLGTLYFLTLGLGGSSGLLIGGMIIDILLQDGRLPPSLLFRIFFGCIALLLTVCVSLILRLERLGATSIKNALSIILSPRNLRSVVLMSKLEQSTSIVDEKKIIGDAANIKTPIISDDLSSRLQSPSLEIRSATLHAIENLPLTENSEAMIVKEIETREYTTAYIAARIAGRRDIKRATPVLRQQLSSGDYILVAKSMVALARLRDEESIGRIETMLAQPANPFVLTHGVAALRIFRNSSSLPLLFSILRKAKSPVNIVVDVLLAIGAVMGMDESFYPLLRDLPNPDTDSWNILSEELLENATRYPEKIGAMLESLANAPEKQRSTVAIATLETLQQSLSDLPIFELAILSLKDDSLQSPELSFFMIYLILYLTKMLASEQEHLKKTKK